jgi:hypothetical protein
MSKILGIQRATAVHTSEMIFVVFSANFLQASFEKKDRSYMPLKVQ